MLNSRSSTIGKGVALALLLVMAGWADAGVALIDLTAPGDQIIAVAAAPGSASSAIATIGTVPATNNYPSGETPAMAIDNIIPPPQGSGNKYLNFAETNAGFITRMGGVAPAGIVSGVRFAAGNDARERDPLTITIEGTNSTSVNAAASNAVWTQVYSGPTGLATDPGRNTLGPTITFANALPFDTYRLLVTSVQDGVAANSFQFAEVELLGIAVPEPASLSLLALSGLALMGRRRK